MQIHLTSEDSLILREGDTLLAHFNAVDSPVPFPQAPQGCASAILDTTTGLTVGYDQKGNAFPKIEWEAGVVLAASVDSILLAEAVKKAEQEAAKAALVKDVMVVLREVVQDTENVATKTEVIIA